ncbi:MAG: SDR family NAD(P)-dependent oxidoreductase [Candidatus Parcubacteria bacterium]|nr:SDR family NAD(P)-dependent oxidoreductase [Candidatus Parcubacteria bacterium]
MKILITGGAGFIGSNLATYLLKKKHQIIVLDNLRFGYLENLTHKDNINFQFIKMDVRDREIERVIKNVDVIFHFAGMNSLSACQNDPQETFSVNIMGTINILEIARKCNIKRIIFSSSSAVYENEKSFPLTEDMQVNPTLAYSLSKKSAEEICRTYQDLYGMDIVLFRFFNVYGPHMDFRRTNPPFISYVLTRLLKDEIPVLHSDGKQARDMIYIEDVLQLCEITLTHKNAKNQTFNVGSGKAFSINEIYKHIASYLDKEKIKPIFRKPSLLWDTYPNLFKGKFPLQKSFVEDEVHRYTLASIKKAKKLLHWEPSVSLAQGLKKTTEFATQNY